MSSSRRHRAKPGLPPSPVPAHERGVPRLVPGGGGRGDADAATPAVPARRELWIAVHLPDYVLESLKVPVEHREQATVPPAAMSVAVVDLERGARVIRASDAGAAAAGVVPGMALNSALALLPALEIRARDLRRERTLLEIVATHALDFTPRVNLDPPDGVLLEVRGSLRLFGGVRSLVARLRERVRSLGSEPRIALAPTPLASLWLARAGEEVLLRRLDALPGRLGRLPLACTRWPEGLLRQLATMGVRVVGDCLRLPRDGVARRFEQQVLPDLDRALGRVADPRAAFAALRRFVTRRDLEPETDDAGRLGRVLEPLIVELCTFLVLRGRAIEVLGVQFVHRDGPATRLRQQFAEPVNDAGRISGLLRERLSAVVLPSPVRQLRLLSGPLVEARAQTLDLLARDRRDPSGVPQLVERLRARLGADAVHGLSLVPEHRPESAWQQSRDASLARSRRAERSASPPVLSLPPRPVWLLPEPQALAGERLPSYHGPLELEEGPERIESGWWDGHDVRRDYYVARTRTGVRLWIFRERRSGGGWFLHGVFG
jgi:protein ImuB